MAERYQNEGATPDNAGFDRMDAQLKEWQTPELLTDTVQAITRGGTLLTGHSSPDDAYYS